MRNYRPTFDPLFDDDLVTGYIHLSEQELDKYISQAKYVKSKFQRYAEILNKTEKEINDFMDKSTYWKYEIICERDNGDEYFSENNILEFLNGHPDIDLRIRELPLLRLSDQLEKLRIVKEQTRREFLLNNGFYYIEEIQNYLEHFIDVIDEIEPNLKFRKIISDDGSADSIEFKRLTHYQFSPNQWLKKLTKSQKKKYLSKYDNPSSDIKAIPQNFTADDLEQIRKDSVFLKEIVSKKRFVNEILTPDEKELYLSKYDYSVSDEEYQFNKDCEDYEITPKQLEARRLSLKMRQVDFLNTLNKIQFNTYFNSLPLKRQLELIKQKDKIEKKNQKDK